MDTQERYRTYRNGAIFDTEKGRIVANPGGGKQAFTSVSASQAVQQRIERKRQALAAGARKALEASGRVVSGDLAFVEAIGEALIESATDPSNRQQVRAAELLIRETGLSERTEQPAGGSMGQAADLITALAQFAAAINGADVGSDAVIDADAFDNYNYRNQPDGDQAPGTLAPGTLPSTGTGQPDTGSTG